MLARERHSGFPPTHRNDTLDLAYSWLRVDRVEMTDKDGDTEEPHDDVHSRADDVIPQPKGRRSFGKVRRELTDDELRSSGVQKMMLDELYRLENVESELKTLHTECSEVKTKLAVAGEKLKTHHAFDILSTGSIAAGSIIVSEALPLPANNSFGWALLVLGLAVVVIGVAAKVVKT